MNGVLGAPSSMVSIVRISARHAEPRDRSALEIVPEPMMVPAPSGRVRAAWAISWGKSKFMSVPALGVPISLPLCSTMMSAVTLAPSHAVPKASGVTAAGANDVGGLDWKKPNPLPSSPGIRLRRLTSLQMVTSLMWLAAICGLTPIGTSSVITATSASKSMPQSSSAISMSSTGPSMVSEPPWYISGSSRKLAGISAPRASCTRRM